MDKPYVLDIKCNSLDDGPGVRSTIFFKGCPLSCVWCHNPESKRVNVEISYDAKECIGCGKCIATCNNGGLGKVSTFVDRSKCKLCFSCTKVCPAKAITRVGNEMTYDEILKKVISDKPFYDISGGGVTLSGGEATLFTEWVGGLAKLLKENGINVLIETCGYFNYDKAREFLLPYVKDIYCDIKIFDSEKHKKYCGVPNELILENFKKMFNDSKVLGFNLLPRTPLVPNITDTEENITQIAKFYKELGVEKTELLPYNPTWYSKADKLGVEIDPEIRGLSSFQPKEVVDKLKDIVRSYGISCK